MTVLAVERRGRVVVPAARRRGQVTVKVVEQQDRVTVKAAGGSTVVVVRAGGRARGRVRADDRAAVGLGVVAAPGAGAGVAGRRGSAGRRQHLAGWRCRRMEGPSGGARRAAVAGSSGDVGKFLFELGIHGAWAAAWGNFHLCLARRTEIKKTSVD
jgi:hypothetical protein